MRYWAYVNNQTLGPYELSELPKIEGFTPDLLICPEYPPEGKQQEWVPASSVMEQQAVAETPAPAAEAPAVENPPVATPDPSSAQQPASQEPPQQAAPLQASMMPAPGVELVSAADAVSGDSGKTSQFTLGGFEIEQFPQSQPSPVEYKPEPLLQQASETAAPSAQEPAPASAPATLGVSPIAEPEPAAPQQASPFEYKPSPLPAAEREIQLETFPSPEPVVRQAAQYSAPAAYSPSPVSSEPAPQVSDSQLVAEVSKSVSEIEHSLAEANKMLAEYKAVAQSVPAPSGAQMETQLQSVMGELNTFKKEVHALIEERIKLEQEILSGLASLGVQPAAGGISAQHIEPVQEYAAQPVAIESAADAAMPQQDVSQPQAAEAAPEMASEQPAIQAETEPEQQSAASSGEDSFDVPAFEPAAQAELEPAPQPSASMEAATLSAPEEKPAAASEAAAAGPETPTAASEQPQTEAEGEKPATDQAAKRKKLIMIGAVIVGVIVLFLILGLLQLLPSAVNPFAKKKLPVPVMTPVTPEAVPAKADIKRDADMIALVKAWKASSGTTVEEMATSSGNVPQWKAQQDASGACQVSATYSSGGAAVSYVFSVSGDGKVAPANKEAQNLIARFSNSPATLKDKPLPQQTRQPAAVAAPAKAPASQSNAPAAMVPAQQQPAGTDSVSQPPAQPVPQQNAPAAPKAVRQRRPRGTAKKPAAAKPAAAPAAAVSAAQPAAPLQQEEIIEEEVVEEP